MVTSEQVREVLVSLFEKTANKKKIPLNEVDLKFSLSSSTTFICRCLYDNEEVNVGDAGMVAMLAKGYINSYIVNALNKYSESDNISNKTVNILMSIDDSKNISLNLRNGVNVIKPIQIEDILN